MDSSVDEEEVNKSSGTSIKTSLTTASSVSPSDSSHRRERDGPSESIITSLKSLDRVVSNSSLVGSSSTSSSSSGIAVTGVTSSSSSSSSSSSLSSLSSSSTSPAISTFISTTSSPSSTGSSSSSSVTAIASVQGTGSLGANANSLRTANGIVFASVPSPSSSPNSGVKHNNNNNHHHHHHHHHQQQQHHTTIASSPVSQTIAVPQPGGAVSIVQLQLPNQTNVVQSVIQPVNQQSVIQATGGAASAVAGAVPTVATAAAAATQGSVQTVSIPKNIIFLNKGGQGSVIQSTETNEMNSIQPLHLISNSRGGGGGGGGGGGDHGDTHIPTQQPPQTPSPILDEEAKARREGLTRRPSYRKIFNDLSATNVGSSSSITDIKSEDDGESSESSNAATIAVASPYLKVVPTSTIQLASAGQDGTIQGLQTLTMTNAASGGNTIVQYATQGQDGQFFVPVTVSTADLQAYQLRTGAGGATGLPQSVVMTTPTTLASPHGHNPDETAKKREMRLLKNREAAKECRRKKKEYIKCLEQRVTVLETQNKALIEELKSLKELYLHQDKGN